MGQWPGQAAATEDRLLPAGRPPVGVPDLLMGGPHVVLESILAHVIFCVQTVFTPVLAKHSNCFCLLDCVSVGVDRVQRSLQPMRKKAKVSVL
jgi:hypothetical protein